MFFLDWDMNFDLVKSVKKTFPRGEIKGKSGRGLSEPYGIDRVKFRMAIMYRGHHITV